MKVIAFSNIKGGVGKTSLSILTANILSQNKYKVLCIDTDIQNSMSFYYLDNFEQIEDKNLFNVFNDEKITDNIIPITDYISLIPSQLKLINFRNTARTNILQKAFKELQGCDFIIIDTPPTFDNILINVFKATDLIILPVNLALFDYKAVTFLFEQFTDYEIETPAKLAINRIKHTDNEENNIFLKTFIENYKVIPAYIPDTAVIKRYIENKEHITQAKNKIKVFELLSKFIFDILNVSNQMEMF
ncbi:MAG TPA: ParA family protein [Bacteroidales bacterium]|nr:ParA family protein [Bacteroidales bacterium]